MQNLIQAVYYFCITWSKWFIVVSKMAQYNVIRSIDSMFECRDNRLAGSYHPDSPLLCGTTLWHDFTPLKLAHYFDFKTYLCLLLWILYTQLVNWLFIITFWRLIKLFPAQLNENETNRQYCCLL